MYRLLHSLSFYMVFMCILFSCLLLSLHLRKVCSFRCWHLMFLVGVTPSSEKKELLSSPQWPCFAVPVQNKPRLVTAGVLRGWQKAAAPPTSEENPREGGAHIFSPSESLIAHKSLNASFGLLLCTFGSETQIFSHSCKARDWHLTQKEKRKCLWIGCMLFLLAVTSFSMKEK